MIPYVYKVVRIERVIDGDTVIATLDVGFFLTTTLRLRLLGVDTPEHGLPGGTEATEFTRSWLASAGEMTATTHKTDNFGRYLADIADGSGSTLSQALLDAHHAVPYFGGKKP